MTVTTFQGQMIFIKEWDQMLFLACPIMKGLNNLIWSGLFINDLRYPLFHFTDFICINDQAYMV